MRKYLPPLILFFLLLIGWQALALGINAAYILPTPIQVIQKLWELREPLFMVHLPATMSVTFIGLGISIVLGLALAIAMDMHEGIRRTLYPLVIASQTIPTTAIAPLFVLWFGYSIWSKVLVTVLMTFFPITITVYDGFQSTKREMEELMLSFNASKMDIFMKLKLPNALPYFFSAIKMAIRRMAGCTKRSWLFQQTYADTAGWCRCLRPDCLIIRSGYVDCRDCRYYRKNCDPMAKRTVNTMIEHL